MTCFVGISRLTVDFEHYIGLGMLRYNTLIRPILKAHELPNKKTNGNYFISVPHKYNNNLGGLKLEPA